MTDLNPFQQAVKALALGKPDANELARPLLVNETERFALYVTAVFVGIVERHFKDDHSPAAITGFMEELRYAFRDANPPLKPLATEALIKAVWDENHPIDEISSKDQHLSQLSVIRMITHESEEIRHDLDGYLSDAETLAQAWINEIEEENKI
ncbi:hypothetical protein [Natronoglycomyces albus]|uniref:Uncharacterized protein n=1 Tax=Natronoglycomyces albus TaxID=2811108 RepID=A0A895XNJ6_9ACTN|nr:hypothetical protein [Natronoglycomyces albus]QSB04959.1 hypothetical protein JQS30_14525 [Natronoglycomyces albus]